MILQDTWVVPQTANPTHDFGGAANSWASVTIENDTTFSIAVNPQQGNPPTGLVDAWRVIPPGANVTWPLYSNGVSYRVLGTPSSSTVVQTVLSTDAAPAGGTTGSVNVASGTVNVTGPVNVQTASGVNLSMFSGFATATTIPINNGTTTQSIPIQANVQKLELLYGQAIPGGPTVLVTVTGDTTGTRYFRGQLPRQDSISIMVAGSSTGIAIDASVTVTIVASINGGDLVVVQSYATPSLSANDILPTATQAAAITYNKNLFVNDVGGKLFTQTAVVGASQNSIAIAAPGVGAAITLQSILMFADTAQAGSFTQVGGGAVAAAPIVLLGQAFSAGIQYRMDYHGFCLPENTELRVTTNAGSTPTWRYLISYSLVSLP